MFIIKESAPFRMESAHRYFRIGAPLILEWTHQSTGICSEAVPKSKKLLKFTLNDGSDRKRTILSGIHEYYEPEELVGKTAIAITNLPPRKMMGIDSEGMLISAVYEYDGHEGLNLLMVDDQIPAGAKLY